MSKAQRTVEFGSSVGLHARPASALAKAAGESGHTITLTTPAGKKANAASILTLLAMGVSHGDEVTITVEGDDAEAVAESFAALVASELDAD
ncbi:MAG: HPr family phosphocarrier protein [Leifsonia sp.]|nr:HPr family phosphocarrier protein [Leifsonia sp.]|tara:strand:- start:260039 stop:260314 length:276 start_codon:yes stop_codon:yes gene_type:complete